MIISHEHRFIYFVPHRTASTSIMKVLSEKYAAQVYGSFYLHGKHDCYFPLLYEDYFTFASVRNPYARFVSYWNFLSPTMTFEDVMLRCPTMFGQIFSYPLWKIEEDTVPVRLDKFIKLENLQTEFNELPFNTDKPILPHLNAQQYTVKLTSEQVKIIRGHYSVDFRMFGYDFDDVPAKAVV